MRNDVPAGEGMFWTHEAVDPQVPNEELDAYITDARTRWDTVTVEPNQE